MNGKLMVDGQICPYRHVKRCKKFCRHGAKGKQGCRRGNDCKFFHPTLCKFSVKSRLCTNKSCKFTHLRGTAREAPKKGETQKANSRGSQKQKRSSKENAGNFGSSTQQVNPFLEVMKAMEEMRSSFNYELTAIRSLIGIQRPPIQVSPPPGFDQYRPNLLFQPTQQGGITIPQSSC